MTSKTILMARSRFTQASYTLRVDTNGVVENLNFTVVPNRDYFPTGENEDDTEEGHGDLIRRLLQCLNSNAAGAVYSASVSDVGVLTLTCTAAFQIQWSDPSSNLDPELFGFANEASPNPPALTVTAPAKLKGFWVPDQGVFRTNWGERRTVGVSEVAISETVLGFSLSEDHVFWSVKWIFLHQNYVRTYFAEQAGDRNNCIETLFFENGLKTFGRFRLYLDWTLNRDPQHEHNPTLRLANQETPWTVEEEQRLTSYRVVIEALEDKRPSDAVVSGNPPYDNRFALQFNGNNQECTGADHPEFDNLTRMTIAFWMKPGNDSGYQSILSKFDWGVQESFEVVRDTVSKKLRVNVPSVQGQENHNVESTNALVDDVYVFVGVAINLNEVNNDDRVKLYFNAVLDATAVYSGAFPSQMLNSNSPFKIGNYVGGSSFFTGLLDAPAIWLGQTASLEQFEELYGDGTTVVDPFSTSLGDPQLAFRMGDADGDDETKLVNLGTLGAAGDLTLANFSPSDFIQDVP